MAYFSVNKTGMPGQCQRCKNEAGELYEFEVTSGDVTKNYRLCRDCSRLYYSVLKNKGLELRQAEKQNTINRSNNLTYKPKSNNINPESANKKRIRPLPIIITAATLVIVIVITAIAAPQLVKSVQKKRGETGTYVYSENKKRDTSNSDYSLSTPILFTADTARKYYNERVTDPNYSGMLYHSDSMWVYNPENRIEYYCYGEIEGGSWSDEKAEMVRIRLFEDSGVDNVVIGLKFFIKDDEQKSLISLVKQAYNNHTPVKVTGLLNIFEYQTGFSWDSFYIEFANATIELA